MFLITAFAAAAKTWMTAEFLRPADLVLTAEAIAADFLLLEGDTPVENGMTKLSVKISEQMAVLDLLTLTSVLDTALVCTQEATVDSADVRQGVGDAGLAGICLIIASLADVAARAEGEIPANTDVVRSMLTDWANRSRPLTKALRRTPPGGEFEVTFRHQGFAQDLTALREGLSGTCSEILIFPQTDALGFANFTTHVHTPSPLSALPHPHESGVLISHLSPPPAFSNEEDPLEATGNVVMFSRTVPKLTPRISTRLIVLSEAAAMTESLARSGAVVLLNTANTEQVKWALEASGQSLALVIPASPSAQELAQQTRNLLLSVGNSDVEPWFCVASTEDELAAALLVESLSRQEYTGDLQAQVSALEMRSREALRRIRSEEIALNQIDSQIEELLFSTTASDPEIIAIIGTNQAEADRTALQLAMYSFPQATLTTYYGGQPGPTVIGVRV